MRANLAVLAVFLAMGIIPIAAQDTPSADHLIEEAIQKRNAGDATAALPLFEQAATLYREAKDPKGEAVAFKEMGNTYEWLGEHRQAIECQRQVLEIAERIKDRDLQARALVNLGISLHSLGQDAQALDYDHMSLAIASDDGNAVGVATAQWAIGNLFIDAGRNEEAIAPLKAAGEAAHKAGDLRKEDSALAFLGLAYSNLKKREESIATYSAALALARQLNDRSGEATLLSSLAQEYFSLGDFDHGIDLAKQGLAIGNELKILRIQTLTLGLLSTCYLTRSDFSALLDTARQLQKLAHENEDSALEEGATLNIALSYTQLGDAEKAATAYRELIPLARKNGNSKNAAIALQSLGDYATLKGDHTEAIKRYTELRELAQNVSDPDTEVSALNSLGTEREAVGQREEAISLFTQALDLAERNGNKLEKATALRKLGIARLARHEILEGADLLDQGCSLTEEMLADWKGHWKKEGTLLNHEGDFQKTKQSLDVMVSMLHEIVETFYVKGAPKPDEIQGKTASTPLPAILDHLLTRARGSHDQLSEAHILILLGEMSLRSGDAAKAVDLSTQALDLGRSLRAEDVEGRALTALSQAYIFQGDFAAAIRHQQELLSLFEKKKDSKSQAVVLGMLANTYLGYGDLDKAVALGEQARSAATEQHLELVEASALKVLSKASNARFDSRAAIHWSEEALRLARSRVDPDAEREALSILGDSLIEQGDFGRAITACNQGLSKATAATEPVFLHCLGVAYDNLQDDKQAEELLERALGKARELKDPEREAEILIELGRHHFLLGERQPAAEYYEQGARLFLSLQGSFAKANAESFLGVALVLRGDTKGAVPHFQRALDLFNLFASTKYTNFKPLASNLQASTMRFLIDAYDALGETDKELAYAEQEWESQKESTDPTPRALALSELGRALWRIGRLEPATEAVARAIREWEAARSVLAADAQVNKATLLDVQGETYELLERLLVAQGKSEAALEIAERSRARAFVEALSAKTGGSPPTPLSLDAIRQLAQERKVTFVEYSILYDPAGILLPNRARDGLQQFEKEMFVWVVKPTGEIVFEAVDLKAWSAQTGNSLATTVRGMRTSVGGRGRGVEPLADRDLKGPLHRLYDLLIAPIAGYLPNDPEARIVIVPQGPLFLVPFAALQAPSGRYLIEDHTLLLAPSIDSLTSIQRHTIQADWKSDEVLVVGNPTIAAELKLAPYNLPDLPESGKEAAAIASSFGAQPLTRDTAGKAAILQLLPRRRLLHLATHGLLEGFGDPIIPGTLVLAPGKNDDGLLTAKEILDLDLHADLVVLSACDTGGGRITSDGVIGLSRAFLSAGAPNVVVSLWSIPDDSTSRLMQRFYRELKDNPDPGRALRQAMLATMRMKDSPPPQRWAGFTLIGGLP